MARNNDGFPARTMTPAHSLVARTLGRRLRYLRSQIGVTQEAIGRSLDTDRSYISRLERGAVLPRLSTLVRLAIYFGVDVSTLLGNRPTSKCSKGK